MTRLALIVTLVGLASLAGVDGAAARHSRHRRVAHNTVVIPSGPAASAGVLFGLVDTGISPATDAYPGFPGIPPGYGFYGHGYYGPGYGSPGY